MPTSIFLTCTLRPDFDRMIHFTGMIVHTAADTFQILFAESKAVKHDTKCQASSLFWDTLTSLNGTFNRNRERLRNYIRAGRLPKPEEMKGFGPNGEKAFATMLSFLWQLMKTNRDIFVETPALMNPLPQINK